MKYVRSNNYASTVLILKEAVVRLPWPWERGNVAVEHVPMQARQGDAKPACLSPHHCFCLILLLMLFYPSLSYNPVLPPLHLILSLPHIDVLSLFFRVNCGAQFIFVSFSFFNAFNLSPSYSLLPLNSLQLSHSFLLCFCRSRCDGMRMILMKEHHTLSTEVFDSHGILYHFSNTKKLFWRATNF